MITAYFSTGEVLKMTNTEKSVSIIEVLDRSQHDMATLLKASVEESQSYSGLYKLYGRVKVGATWCDVEYLGEGQGEPNYEVMAPEGMIFMPDGTHTLLASTLRDLHNRVADNTLEKDADTI